MSISCEKHARRIMYTPDKIMHRNGDGSLCDSPRFKTGETVYTRTQLHDHAAKRLMNPTPWFSGVLTRDANDE